MNGAPQLDDATQKAQTKAAADCFMHLGKAIKNVGLYLHNTARHPEIVAPAAQAFAAYTEAYGPLGVRVEADGFYVEKTLVFAEDFANEAIAYKFYRDGIRQLVFRPGLDVPELKHFVDICMTSSRSRHARDVLGLLWEAELEDIEYVVVDGFAIEGMDDDEVEIEVDKIVSYLYARLKSNSDDYLRFARLQAQDLETQLDDVDQIRGAIVQGIPASDEQKAGLQEEIELDERERMLPKLVNIVFRAVEEGGEQSEQSIRDVFLQLLDAMLLQEDFASINHILTKLKSLERDPARGDMFARLRELFVAKMGEEERLRKIGEILNTSRPENPKDIFRYLFNLDSGAVVPLLEILETVEIPENREILCDALVALGRENADPFVHRLQSEKSQLVRDMIYVIDRIDFPDKVKMFGQVLANPNLAVRLEGLGIIARSKTEECRQLVADCLGDPNAQMRVQAARLLPVYDGTKAYMELARLVKTPEFLQRDLKEKIQIYSALGSTQEQGALAHFAQLLQHKSLFNKKKLVEDKLLAIAGLSTFVSIPSFKLLQAESQTKTNPPEVIAAARRGMGAVRTALFGAEEGEA